MVLLFLLRLWFWLMFRLVIMVCIFFVVNIEMEWILYFDKCIDVDYFGLDGGKFDFEWWFKFLDFLIEIDVNGLVYLSFGIGLCVCFG